MRGVAQVLVLVGLLRDPCPGPSKVDAPSPRGRAPACAVRAEPPRVPEGAPRFVDIASSTPGTCAATVDGRVLCWGKRRAVGLQPEGPDWSAQEMPLPDGFRAVGIGMGWTGGCARGDDGTVACWGANELRATVDRSVSTVAERVPGITGAIDLAVHNVDACAVSRDGRVRCWGQNRAGRIRGDEDPGPPPITPTALPGMRDAVSVAMSHDRTCAVGRSGGVTCWPDHRPIDRLPVHDAIAVGVAYPAVCVARRGGSVDCWGRDQLSVPAAASVRVPVDDVVALSGQFFLRADGRMAAWGARSWGPELADRLADITEVAPELRASRLDAVGGAACALDGKGHAWCWGGNNNGETGVPRLVTTGEPVPVCGVDDIVQIAALGTRTCALRRDGELWCAGLGGAGVPSGIAAPVPGVDRLSQFVLVGQNGGCGARRDGRVVCWGDVLAQNNFAAGPRLLPGLSGAVQVAVGDDLLCALREDGSAVCAGSAGVLVPAPVMPGTRIAELAAGEEMCARLADGRLACWGGRPIPGACRSGGCVIHCDPPSVRRLRTAIPAGVTRVEEGCAIAGGKIQTMPSLARAPGSLPDVPAPIDAACGHLMSCAVSHGGRVWCRAGTASQATLVPGLADAIAVTAGAHHACALRTDGTASCWGENGYGQLASGSTGYVHEPSPVDLTGL